MAKTVNQWGNPKAKEIYNKYVSVDNKDKAYIPESDYYSPENVERRRQVQDKINSMPEDALFIPETPESLERHPSKTMDEYLGSLNPNDKVAAIPSNQSNVDWESLREPWTATNWVETLGTTVPQNTQNATNSENGTSANSNDWTIKVWEQNANLNYYQYWDDSNPAQQWQKGWMNPKYTGEWVSNSYIEYNPDLTVADLDPNYLYWENARQQNRQEAWYIARRNDNIASALYNEWLTSRWDVANYLNSQNWFTNSTEADRENTIESIYKRLWQIQPTEEVQPDLSKADEIVQDTSWTIYWKTTADEWEPSKWIDTLADANSVFKATQEDQVRAIEEFMSLDIDAVATCVAQWINWGWTDQTWRDVQKYYPERIDAINQRVKEIRTQNAVNNISNWSTDYVTSEVDAKKSSISSNVDNMASQYSNSEVESDSIRADIENSVAKNQSAWEASKTMENIESEVARLKNRLKNLRQEANSVFKWDAPDYLVNAYINNKTQEINNQLSILEDRYNAAYSRYTNEVNNEWKQKEFDLKREQLDLQIQQQWFNQWYQKQTLAKSNMYTDSNGTTWELKTWQDWTLYYEKVEKINNYSGSWMKGKWLKNNNPWNIKDNEFWNVIWHDESWFAIFATPEDWFDALVEKIIYNQTNPNSRYYWKTIREYFRIYAPSSDGNNPDAYANSVAKQLWVSVDTPISELDPVLFAKEIAKHDSGYNYDTYGQFRGWWVTDTTWWKTFTDRDYKNFEKFMNPDTSASDKKVIAQQYWYGDDLEWMTKFANNALDSRSTSNDFDINSIEIPDSVYIVDDWYQERKVDPNSEEWKKLKQEYINNYIKENWLNVDTNNSWAMKVVRLKSGEEYKMPMDFYRYIYNPIPSRQKDSDEDKRWIIEDILELYNQWLTASEAFLVYNGIDLNSEYADNARTLINYLMWAWKDIDEWIYSSIVYNLANWDIAHAISAVENFIIPDDMKSDLVDIAALAEKISDFIELTNDPEYTKYFWPFDSPINKEIWKVAWNPDAVKAYADLWNIYADIRQWLMWNAATEFEAKTYAPILAESNENLNTIIQKLNSTLQWQMARYNAIRWQFWLPRLKLDDEDLIDMVLYPEARIRLYEDDNNW